MAGIVVAGGLVLVAWNAPWMTVTLAADSSALEVRGASAAPALSAIAIACVALAGALSIAARILRYVAAVLLAGLGLGVVLASQSVIADPLAGAEGSISTVTGVAGSASVRSLVSSTELSFWPYVAIVGGVLLVLLAAGIAATAHSWPASGRRYASPQVEPGAAAAKPAAAPTPRDVVHNTADDWDSLTGGNDPTD
ncbi:Trp biosynthesis-associated membrane protein [Naasia lichenicola]|uniref:Trp biosynthesis-associated membrane protein n=1 Tax=Naasia lichenicola TaxID=2565933 RepID=A0A4S4FR41_9MICO|nr:Trp biosynthesis-associated membrane protein [Naasia lichenicola]THG33069.1 hypothetical protein E6C64_01530 [Naasia lichenicola]